MCVSMSKFYDIHPKGQKLLLYDITLKYCLKIYHCATFVNKARHKLVKLSASPQENRE
jgi:hypothetical protein